MTTITIPKKPMTILQGEVYCPSCTHTVPADVAVSRRNASTVAGQRCPRCASLLDAAKVMYTDRAA